MQVDLISNKKNGRMFTAYVDDAPTGSTIHASCPADMIGWSYKSIWQRLFKLRAQENTVSRAIRVGMVISNNEGCGEYDRQAARKESTMIRGTPNLDSQSFLIPRLPRTPRQSNMKGIRRETHGACSTLSGFLLVSSLSSNESYRLSGLPPLLAVAHSDLCTYFRPRSLGTYMSHSSEINCLYTR
jgi:hypothetical protein